MPVTWPSPTVPHLALWAIAALSTAGVILRPWHVKEAVWAVAGAALLVVTGLASPRAAGAAVLRGEDVYLFLAGMMLLVELARSEGLFDWVAAHALGVARGSGHRLFALVYAIGAGVTVFMSNDATAVVLTPAVCAAARHARAPATPHLYACALVANAASFVLPISNPANLVVFDDRMPPLVDWVRLMGLPALAAIVMTYGAAAWLFRHDLAQPIEVGPPVPTLSTNGRIAGWALGAVGCALLFASALGLPLGAATLATSGLAVGAVLARERMSPLPLLRHVAWDVLALVAGLFVIVSAVESTGLLAALVGLLRQAVERSPLATARAAGAIVALASNAMNNLPAGLVAGTVVNASHAPEQVRAAVAIGIDLGPNLSVTGSLATILWLAAMRREGEHVSAWSFLRVGAVAMPLALVPALLLA